MSGSAGPSATWPRVYLVRHGDTPWTVSGQMTGRSDLPLTEEGERQARDLAPRLRDVRAARVWTSPLLRARQTAALAGFPDAETDPDLQEWDYGAYEGRHSRDVRAERPGWRLFIDGCPGGEMPDAVGVRADRVIARLRAAAADVIVFGHRDLLRVLAARWVELPPAGGRYLWLTTASVSVLGYDHDLNEPVIRAWNTER